MMDRDILSAEDDGIFEQALALLEIVHGGSRSLYRDIRELDPVVERRDTLVAVVDGLVVGHLQVLPREMRVGRSVLRVAGLALLAVNPAELGNGHEQALIQAALRRIASDGYHLSLVFAESDDPFGEFGWETLPVQMYVADLDDLGEQPATPGVRRMNPASDLAWIAAVHGNYGSAYSGPLVRSLGWWSGNMKWMPENPESSFVLVRDGRVFGYARARYPVAEHGDGAGDFYSISDLAAMDEEGETDLLAGMAHDARSRGFRNLAGRAPIARRAVNLLRAIGITARVKSDPRIKLKLVDLLGLFQWLRPEFSATLSRSSVSGPGTVAIRAGAQSVEISYGDGAVRVCKGATELPVEVSEADLWALVFTGAAPPGARGNQAEVIKSLFRKREFAFWGADAF